MIARSSTPTSSKAAASPRSEPLDPHVRQPSGSYVVRAGDTLWSIAAARVGGNASAAAVAREVQRLWRLNGAALGTGSPDLLFVGQHLRLG